MTLEALGIMYFMSSNTGSSASTMLAPDKGLLRFVLIDSYARTLVHSALKTVDF